MQRRRWLCGLSLFLIFVNVVNGQADSLELKIGGALRFNYNLSSWKEEQVKRGGDFGYDVFRINASGSFKKIGFNAEYRLYSNDFGGGMLKQGWFEYTTSDKSVIHVGLNQVPIGFQTYNSNNWFFSLPYYVGLEDDHDMGIKWIYSPTNRLTLQAAFYKNAEELVFGNVSEVSHNRYSYDVSGRNKEANQANAKVGYQWGNVIKSTIELSAMYGGLYNIVTEKMGSHHALAVGYRFQYSNWDLKLQAIAFEKSPNDSVQYKDVIQMAAYGAAYNVAAKGEIYTASLAYDIPVKDGLVNNIRLYNDFSWFKKSHSDFADSFMNVLGCMIAAGPVYTYIDSAWGKNHSWLGPEWNDAFAGGNNDADWHMRFNINIGYYF